ncbi:TonB-dependent receptor plug domain-containing protein [Pleionea sediminis]|uniref:TonB-dependent receptor plug domain-containing protein n=1 Tax=Pleionea sediminis TaxID=2569479 RepID=UPI0011849D54|nr:TonB-dependent receptor [Pleionea sediminis]
MTNHRSLTRKFGVKATALAIAAALTVPVFSAEDENEDEKAEVKVVVVGSRAAPRSVGESAVPVDIISGDEFESQGITDMNSMLSVSVPSYNVNAQPISDAATLVRPANLRGLSPDSTLILVNGKRRHRASVIAFLGGGISDGSQGPDISVIPSVALKQIEVLRDGAAAQYGSDAVAGVMNFVLNDSSSGGYFEAQTGQFYEGDGTSLQLSGNVGMELTERGFLNLSMEYKQADPTDRSVQRDDAADLISWGNDNVADPAQIWGSPEVKDDLKFFFNSGIDLDNQRSLYFFGNWAEREIEGGFFFRNPHTRPGVFSNDDGDTLLVGDPNNADNTACPFTSIDIITDINGNQFPDPTQLAAIEADPNCFTHYSRFPGGFTPRFGGTVSDQSLAIGYKGETDSGMTYDVSYTYGKNEAEFAIKNTVNAALGEDTPTAFAPGAYTQEETGLFAGITYPINNGVIAAGFESRNSEFTITAGNPESYEFNPNLAEQGFGIGSNGFPGFKDTDAGSWDRGNIAVYVDGEFDLSPDFLLTAAVRHEDYDDFGTTTNFKLSARWQTTDNVAFRAAGSTGFRAPTVGQSRVRNVTTAFENGELQDQATLPPTDPGSILKGAEPLEAEEAVNFSIGSVIEFDDLFITIDYYNIKMEDRITLSSTQALSDADRAFLESIDYEGASSLSSLRFFTNDFDTTTQGIDLVANYSMEMWGGETDFGLVYNWTDTQVDEFNPDNISETRVRQLEENLPDIRATLSMNHKQGDWRTTVRVNHYSGYYEAHLDAGSLPIEVSRSATVDLELGYDVTDSLNLVFGAQNLFDEYPDENPHQGVAGAKYPVTSPFGFNGGFYYLRAGYSF